MYEVTSLLLLLPGQMTQDPHYIAHGYDVDRLEGRVGNPYLMPVDGSSLHLEDD